MRRSSLVTAIILPGLMACTNAFAQTSVPAGTIVVQNFNSMNAGLALPANWKVTLHGAGLTANYATASGVVTQAAGSGTPVLAGSYNWGTTAGTDRAVGFLANGAATSPGAVMAHFKNTTGATVTTLTVSYAVKRYKINLSPFSISFFSSADGTVWIPQAAGDVSAGVFTGDNPSYTFTNPQTIYKTVTISGLSIAGNSDFYFRWVFTNPDAANGQGLGLDNVAVFAGAATPVVTATLRDLWTTDNAPLGQINSGDQVTYVTVIKNTGTADALNVVLTEPAPANTTLVTGSVKTSALAKDDSYAIAVNTALNVDAPGVLANDYGIPSPAALSFGPVANSSAIPAGGAGLSDNGGAVSVNADGSFSYTPPSAIFTGADKFSYKATNGNTPDNDGFVTITVGTPPVASNDAYTAIGNVQINPAGASNLLGNDGGGGLSIVAVNSNPLSVGTMFTTANGSNITVSANGDFIYNPGPGFNGPESFTYTVDNGFSAPQTATVSISITGMVWFINSAAAAGDGRITSPFNTIAAYTAAAGLNPPAAGDNIFVYENAAAYAGPVTLLDGQKLVGQDAAASLSAITGLNPPVYSIPFPAMNTGAPVTTIVSSAAGVVLNSAGVSATNLLRGFTLGATAGAGISGSGFGTLSISNVSKNGTGPAISLSNGAFAAGAVIDNITTTSSVSAVSFTNMTGMFTVTAGAVTGTTGTALAVSGGTVSVTYGGSITQSANAAMIGISGGHSTGAISFNTGTLAASNGSGLRFDNADGSYNFNGTTSLNGADAGIDILNGSAGTFNFGTGTAITNPAGTAFTMSASNAQGTYSGAMTGNSGLLIDIDNHDLNTFTFQTGNLSSIGSGIRVQNCSAGTVNFNNPSKTLTTGASAAVTLTANTGSTVSFGTGGLAISTTTGAGFTATGGGTVNVTGTGNTVSSTSATALNVTATTIGAGGVTFQSISCGNNTAAADPSHGIILGSTGSGNFTVTGTGGGAAGTGGTIINTSRRGLEVITSSGAISLAGMNFTNAATSQTVTGGNCGGSLSTTDNNNNCAAAIHLQAATGSVALTNISINGSIQGGINANNVNNFVLSNVEVQNAGNEVDENGITLKNVTGTGSMTNINVHDNGARQLYIINTSATLGSMNITGSNFANAPAPNGGQGVLLETHGTGALTVSVGTSTFSNLFTNAFQVAANGSTQNVTLSGNTFTNVNSWAVVQASLAGTVNYTVSNNSGVRGVLSGSGAINIKTDGGSSATGTISGNMIGNGTAGSGAACGGGCSGIFINQRQGGRLTANVTGNTVRNVDASAIYASAGQGGGKLVISITGNLIKDPDGSIPAQAIAIQSGVISGDLVCTGATIGGTVNPGSWPSVTAGAMNRIEGDWDPAPGSIGNEIFLFRGTSTATFTVPGWTTPAATFLNARNSITSANGSNIFASSTITAGSCP